MLYSTYGEVVFPEEAERYWQIVPAQTAENVIAWAGNAQANEQRAIHLAGFLSQRDGGCLRIFDAEGAVVVTKEFRENLLSTRLMGTA
jgi:hypothetical protein